MDLVRKKAEIITAEQRSLISQRYKRVTRAINVEFWGTDSDTAHSLYVGSYGRGTAVDTSDIDILVELPRGEYHKYDQCRGNGQSRLLQSVREAILQTYPRSDVHADGQVVVIDFCDGIKFEILPAFRQLSYWGDWNGKYDYPDANMGGNWLTTNPRAEQQAMKERNIQSNGLLFDTCKHMREIRDTHFSNCKLPGIVIDSFVYQNIGGWHWHRDGEISGCSQAGDYEKSLYNVCPYDPFKLSAPGSGEIVDVTDCVDVLNKVLRYMKMD